MAHSRRQKQALAQAKAEALAQAPRGRSALAALAAVVALSWLAAGGQAHAASVSAAGCTSFGGSWARSYNKQAVKVGNPVRILVACCRAPTKAGVSACHVMVGLAGTRSKGCELVHLDRKGNQVTAGKHEPCS